MSDLKNKILYISYDGLTDALGQSQVLPYLTNLSQAYQYHVISFEKPDRFQQFGDRIQQVCDAANIVWHPLIYTKRPPVLSTIYDIYKLQRKAKNLHQKHAFKVLHCRSYISALIGLSFAKKGKAKFIFDMRGFWADERVDGRIWNLKNPLYKMIYRYFKKKEKEYFIHSDAIVSLTENGKKEILSWNLPAVDAAKIAVIPCCVNLNLFDRNRLNVDRQDSLRKELGLSTSDFVLGYVGSIGTWYMLPEMLNYFKVILQEKPKAKFLFLSGEHPAKIQELATQKGIDISKIIVTTSLHDEVPDYLALFDLSIFFILPVFSKKASSPTKQGELMAMGIPVVCNSGVGDTDYVIQEYNAGYLVNEFSDHAFKKSFVKVQQSKFSPASAIAGAKAFYSLEKGVDSYQTIYQKLLRNG